MAVSQRLICASAELTEGARGARFEIQLQGCATPAFVVRYQGAARAYVNRCPHAGTELDWNPAEFFDDSGLYLICATHGALFIPESGQCAAGPCRGQALQRVAVVEHEGNIYMLEEED